MVRGVPRAGGRSAAERDYVARDASAAPDEMGVDTGRRGCNCYRGWAVAGDAFGEAASKGGCRQNCRPHKNGVTGSAGKASPKKATAFRASARKNVHVRSG